jgi:integrase
MTAVNHLKKANIPGFHSLRRFRVTWLRKAIVPEGLTKYWIGHSSNQNITDRYDKIRFDVVARKQFAVQAGLGFKL